MVKTIGRLVQDNGYIWVGSQVHVPNGTKEVTTGRLWWKKTITVPVTRQIGYLESQQKTYCEECEELIPSSQKTGNRFLVWDDTEAEKLDKILTDGGFKNFSVSLHVEPK
jgi:hypothetical protein